MFDLKVINAVMAQLEEERGVSKEAVLEAIELALANAYRKEYGKRNQIIRAQFNMDAGDVEFSQVKIVVDKDNAVLEDEDAPDYAQDTPDEEKKIIYNPEHHMFLEDAKFMKSDVKIGEEVIFPLEKKDDFGRIAAQTAKQVIMQKIREAEKTSVMAEYGENEGTIVSGTVERMEHGAIYLDMGRAVGMLPYDEQIPGERFKQGERVRAYLYRVEETNRGVFLKLSRSHPKFLEELFKAEVPELTQEIVEIKNVAREAGSRSKIAVFSTDEHVDPVGALVGQRGVRVSTVMSELAGEKIDIIEWSEDESRFVEESLSPAQVTDIELEEKENERGDIERVAHVQVNDDQQSLAIGKGGQNVRLAAKLTGWKIDIASNGIMGEGQEEAAASDENKDALKDALEKVPTEESEADVEGEEKKEDVEVTETKEEVNEVAEESKDETAEEEVEKAEEVEEVKEEAVEEKEVSEETPVEDDEVKEEKKEDE